MGCRESDFSTILDGVHGAKITSWWDRAVDIIPATGGKGTGIAKVLKYYGFDRSEALAFGDGNNDVEMFQAVGTGVAMENASEKLKAIATDHCGHVAEDGIYYYCVEHGLISGWGEKVTQKERIEQLLKESIDGTITAEEVTKAVLRYMEVLL